MDQDFLLVRKMKNGDEAAMECFVRKYYPMVFKYCRYRIFDKGHAQDLVQETFERFFRSLAGYRHHGKAVHYLYTIAGNLCRDYYKNSMEIAVAEFTEAEENQTDQIDSRVDMENALGRLPEELKEVLILYYFQELKLKEIADILGIGLSLVKYRIKRAKEELEKILGREEEERWKSKTC